MRLFVYGGLLKGMTLSPFIEGSEYLGPAFIQAEIYFLGQFPGIVSGNDTVFGELYEVEESMLPGLDKIEHYHPDDLDRSSYIRKELEVICLPSGEKLKAEAYFYNRSVAGQEYISHGDYRRFIQEYGKDKCWVINSILGGKTNGFFKNLDKLPLAKKGSVKTICGLNANGVHDRKQFEVNIVELKRDQILDLDQTKDIHGKYLKASVPFEDEKGEMHMALTYYPDPLERKS